MTPADPLGATDRVPALVVADDRCTRPVLAVAYARPSESGRSGRPVRGRVTGNAEPVLGAVVTTAEPTDLAGIGSVAAALLAADPEPTGGPVVRTVRHELAARIVHAQRATTRHRCGLAVVTPPDAVADVLDRLDHLVTTPPADTATSTPVLSSQTGGVNLGDHGDAPTVVTAAGYAGLVGEPGVAAFEVLARLVGATLADLLRADLGLDCDVRTGLLTCVPSRVWFVEVGSAADVALVESVIREALADLAHGAPLDAAVRAASAAVDRDLAATPVDPAALAEATAVEALAGARLARPAALRAGLADLTAERVATAAGHVLRTYRVVATAATTDATTGQRRGS